MHWVKYAKIINLFSVKLCPKHWILKLTNCKLKNWILKLINWKLKSFKNEFWGLQGAKRDDGGVVVRLAQESGHTEADKGGLKRGK